MITYRISQRTIVPILLVACIGSQVQALTTQSRYHITDLGTLGGSFSAGNGINTSGRVTGWSYAGGGFDEHAFVYDGSMHDLGTLGGTRSFGQDINASGQITGYAQVSAGYDHAFLYDGMMRDLGTLGGLSSYGNGINNHGQVTGYSFLPDAAYYEYRAFIWTEATGMQNLGTLGGASSIGEDINDVGNITGGSETTGGEFHAMLHDGMMHDLGTLGGTYSYGRRNNDTGQVTGISYTTGDAEIHAFLWTPEAPNGNSGTMYDLGTLDGGLSYGYGINESGDVVGAAYTADNALHAFLYTECNGMVDLNTLVTAQSGWELANAVAINDAGQITGWGWIEGQQHAFRLTPVPEPTTIAMLALGGVAVAACRRRRSTMMLCLLCSLSVSTSTQAARYSVAPLGHLGEFGPGSTTALDINNSGQVVGESFGQAFLYDDGVMYGLVDASRAYAINNSGQVAGWYYPAGAEDQRAFLWTPTTLNGHTGTLQDLGTLGGSTSRAFGINDAGHVVGESFTARGEVHGFLYDGEMHDLGTLGGYASANAINAGGQIIGSAFDDAFHATLWDGTLHDLGGFSGAHVYGISINDHGEIVGHWDSETESRSYYLTEPGYVWLAADDIGSFGGTFTIARDINNNGDIVGTANTAVSVQYPFGVQHSFIYTSGGGLVDLNDLIDPMQLSRGPGGVADGLTWANAINDRGQIIAGGWNWYVLTPVPEPSGLALILPTLVLLGYRRLVGSRPGKAAEN